MTSADGIPRKVSGMSAADLPESHKVTTQMLFPTVVQPLCRVWENVRLRRLRLRHFFATALGVRVAAFGGGMFDLGIDLTADQH